MNLTLLGPAVQLRIARAALILLAAIIAVAPATLAQEFYDCTCGGEGESPCGFGDQCKIAQPGRRGCDKGLTKGVSEDCPACNATSETFALCGCAHQCPWPFGNTCCVPELCVGKDLCRRRWSEWLQRNDCAECMSSSRRSATVDDFVESWSYWALADQRWLASNEPINWVMHLAGHNAFNNAADNYPFPNQQLSITDQLRLGARDIMLDVHGLIGNIRLSHGTYTETTDDTCLGCDAFFDRLYVYGIKEIGLWLEQNPAEVMLLQIEDYLIREDRGNVQDFLGPLEKYLGAYALRSNEKPQGRWPTHNEMLSMVPPRQLIILGQDFQDGDLIHDGGWGGLYKYGFGSSKAEVFDAANCSGDGTSFIDDPGANFAEVYEDRSINRFFSPTGWICASNEKDRLIGNDCIDLRGLAECNITIIRLDKLLDTVRFDPGNTERLDRAVWSWEPDHTLQSGQAVKMSGASNLWRSDFPLVEYHFACAKPRTGDPETWEDATGTTWRVTSAIGTWANGNAVCVGEFGSDGLVFSVPVSGLMQKNLRGALQQARGRANWDARSDDVWLNYRD